MEKGKRKYIKRKPEMKRYWLAGMVMVGLLIIIVAGKIYGGMTEDKFCQTKHIATTKLPDALITAKDWLTMGDVDYESGDCEKAIKDLNEAILKNPGYAEAYNNRGYIKMRLKRYDEALEDLNIAIDLRPHYPHALMNRGDIYNYYYDTDRIKAIADYNRVMAMGKDVIKSESVCGHLLMAEHQGNWWAVTWDMLRKKDRAGCLALYFKN
jgi:tetratricopeptide (TPR) repeat protein